MNHPSFVKTSQRPVLWLWLALLGVVWGASGCATEARQAAAAHQNAAGATDAPPEPGALLYRASFSTPASVEGWIMEGPGEIAFSEGGMTMHSPNEAGHHVFWAPEDFPDRFMARWTAQSLDPEAGLVIVFLAATGLEGQDIFSPELPPRDGTFSQYTEGEIKSYHVSYYANAAHNPDRGHANLRKNNTFTLLQKGEVGIPTNSLQEHEITLVKEHDRVRLYVDQRKVIDYTDNTPVVDGVDTGDSLRGGKIGFRQMQWTHFRYKNFRVYGLPDESVR